MKIKILYETADFLVLNKPAGLVVHPDGKTKEVTLTDWILKKYPKLKNVGEPLVTQSGEKILRPGIIHRLDRDTSGVMVIAKNNLAYLHVKKQFQRHIVRKSYIALAHGIFKDREGRIDRPIGRSRSDIRMWTTGRGARGELRSAVTYYRVLGVQTGVTLLELRPETGRTHQIRVHLKAIGHPVIGDPLYAKNVPLGLGFKRLALHARSIQFRSRNGAVEKITAPFPPDFIKALKYFPTAKTKLP